MIAAVIAMTTTSSEREARKLAAGLVRGKLAACVQIVPRIESIYEWKGKIHDDREYLLLIKTRAEKLDALKRFIVENHSYEVPEFLAVTASAALPAYLKWMKDVTKD